jgi:hypothetical protein
MGRLLEATLDELPRGGVVIDNENVHGPNIRPLPKRYLNGRGNSADLLWILRCAREGRPRTGRGTRQCGKHFERSPRRRRHWPARLSSPGRCTWGGRPNRETSAILGLGRIAQRDVLRVMKSRRLAMRVRAFDPHSREVSSKSDECAVWPPNQHSLVHPFGLPLAVQMRLGGPPGDDMDRHCDGSTGTRIDSNGV